MCLGCTSSLCLPVLGWSDSLPGCSAPKGATSPSSLCRSLRPGDYVTRFTPRFTLPPPSPSAQPPGSPTARLHRSPIAPPSSPPTYVIDSSYAPPDVYCHQRFRSISPYGYGTPPHTARSHTYSAPQQGSRGSSEERRIAHVLPQVVVHRVANSTSRCLPCLSLSPTPPRCLSPSSTHAHL